MRRAAFALLAALFLFVAAPTASARDALVNTAVASVDQGGDVDVRLAWSVQRTNSSDVAASNVAIATASCNSCRSVALAFQIVLANRVTGEVRADNLALARSVGCTRCATLAIAYQFVVVAEDQLKLAPRARADLAHIGNQLRQLAHARAATDVLADKATILAAEIRDVLAQELTVSRIPGHVFMRRHIVTGGAAAAPRH